jgi:hypothetical protein
LLRIPGWVVEKRSQEEKTIMQGSKWNLSGISVLNTGATGGIGAALAQLLAERRVRLLLLDVPGESLRKSAGNLVGKTLCQEFDITQPDDLAIAVAASGSCQRSQSLFLKDKSAVVAGLILSYSKWPVEASFRSEKPGQAIHVWSCQTSSVTATLALCSLMCHETVARYFPLLLVLRVSPPASPLANSSRLTSLVIAHETGSLDDRYVKELISLVAICLLDALSINLV